MAYTEKEIKKLLSELTEETRFIPSTFAQKLAELNIKEMIPRLVEMLDEAESDIAFGNIIYVLTALKAEEALEKIRKLVKTKPPTIISIYILDYLRSINNEEAIDILQSMLDIHDDFIFEVIVDDLGRGKVKKAIKPLKERLKIANMSEKIVILINLVRIEGKESEALKTLNEMKKEGKLSTRQLGLFSELCRELEIEERIMELEEKISAHSSKIDIVSTSVKEVEQETDIEKIREQIMYIEEVSIESKTSLSDVQTGFEELKNELVDLKRSLSYPKLETHLHGESIQRQIDDLKEELKDLRKEQVDTKVKRAWQEGKWRTIERIWTIFSTIAALTLSIIAILVKKGII